MVGGAAAVLGALDDELRLFADPGLTDELAQRTRPQAAVDVALADRQERRDIALAEFVEAVAHFFPSNDSAARSAVEVVAS